MLRNVISPRSFVRSYSSFDYQPLLSITPSIYPLFTHAASSIGYTTFAPLRPRYSIVLFVSLFSMYPSPGITHLINWSILTMTSSIVGVDQYPGGIHRRPEHELWCCCCRMLQWPMDDPFIFDFSWLVSMYLGLRLFYPAALWSLFYPPPSQCCSYRNGYYCNHNPSINSLWNSIQFSSLKSADNIRTCLLDI